MRFSIYEYLLRITGKFSDHDRNTFFENVGIKLKEEWRTQGRRNQGPLEPRHAE